MVAAFEANKVFAAILVLINVLLPTLALSILYKGTPFGETSHHLAAWSELLISLLGFYAAGAVFLNSFFGRTLLPLGKPMGWIRERPAKTGGLTGENRLERCVSTSGEPGYEELEGIAALRGGKTAPLAEIYDHPHARTGTTPALTLTLPGNFSHPRAISTRSRRTTWDLKSSACPARNV